MQMLHTSLGKSKKRKPNAQQRQLQADWETLLKKHEPKKPVTKRKRDDWSYSLEPVARRETHKAPSLPFTGAPCTKKDSPVYTGDKIKGIGTMHKSNAVPIFTDEQAVEIATMRRG